MRIEKLSLRNYRQFRHEDIRFHKAPQTDLHILIGENGTGKTNILNAINWCLYADEPHLSSSSRQLPILNLQSYTEGRDGDNQTVAVEIWTRTQDNTRIAFKRQATYTIYDDQEPIRRTKAFEVVTTDDKGNTKILSEEDAASYVARFVPKKIREFFFFDGERLNQYFRGENPNVRKAVFDISQLDLLESQVERKLKTIVGGLEKQAGQLNPQIEQTREERARQRANRDEIRDRIRQAHTEASLAKEQIQELENKLSGIPDVEALEDERKRLKAQEATKQDLRDQALHEKQLLLFKRGMVVMLSSALEHTIRLIEDKEESGEIPPRLDPDILRRALDDGLCVLCGQPIEGHAVTYVQHLLAQIGLSSDVTHRLAAAKAPLHQLIQDAKQLEQDARRATDSIRAFEQDLEDIRRRLAQIDRQVSNYDKEKVKNWYRMRNRYEEIRTEAQQQIGALRQKEKELTTKIDDLSKQLDKELGKETRAQGIKNQRDFCNKALDVVRTTKNAIMQETRKRIEQRTQDLFFDLTWKRETFESVDIGSDYQIALTHTLGMDCLGSISAAERELLALSFTLALHSVSGFNSPILIDTPVARISGEHRSNFGQALAQVSNSKQAILLFTPDEYSEHITRVLHAKANTRLRLHLSKDETVSNIKEL